MAMYCLKTGRELVFEPECCFFNLERTHNIYLHQPRKVSGKSQNQWNSYAYLLIFMLILFSRDLHYAIGAEHTEN